MPTATRRFSWSIDRIFDLNLLIDRKHLVRMLEVCEPISVT